jgi:AcrR family transcriptional regulator
MSDAADARRRSARPRRVAYHHGDLKRALVEAALALIAEKGPKGFSLSEAARRAGVSPAAPYRHFTDKAHLLAAVAEQGFNDLHDALREAAEEFPAPHQRMIEMSRRYVRWAVAHPDHYRVMFGEDMNKADHPGLIDAGTRAFGDLLEVIDQCVTAEVIRGGNPRRIAGPMWSVLHGIASLAIGGELRHVGVDETPEDLAARSISELVNGLARGTDSS